MNEKFDEKQMIKDNIFLVFFIFCLVWGLGFLIQNYIFHNFEKKYLFIIPTLLGLHKINNYFVFVKKECTSVVINDVRYYLRGEFLIITYHIQGTFIHFYPGESWPLYPSEEKIVKYYHAKSEFGDFVVIKLEFISFTGKGGGMGWDKKREGKHTPRNKDYKISSIKEAQEESRISTLEGEIKSLQKEIDFKKKNSEDFTSRELAKIESAVKPIREKINRLRQQI